MNAFGDSITNGFGATQSYASILGATPYALNGGMAMDLADLVYNTQKDESILMLGTNDQRIYGSDISKREYFIRAMRALAVWCAVDPVTAKDHASFVGSWTDTVAYGLGRRSTSSGAKAAFWFSGPTLYLGVIQQQSVPGIGLIRIDGVDIGTWQTSAPVGTLLGRTYGPSCLRIDCGSGAHLCELINVSGTIYVDWWALPSALRRVSVYNVIRQAAAGYAKNGGSDLNVSDYNHRLRGLVDQLYGDGMNVRLLDGCSFVPNSMLFDGIHPNDVGHAALASIF